MLPPFHIRNLQPSSLPKASQDTLVRINAPRYDETITSYPAATLKYHDEDDGDLITLGSSRELTEKLEEPLLPPFSGLLANLQHGLQSSEHHVFEIDDRDYVQKLWQEIQSSSKDPEDVPVSQARDDATIWSAEKKNRLAVFYERRKREIWNPFAEEIGVSWQSVEAMVWALGKDEMARRAYEFNPDTQQPGSSEEAAETRLDPSYNTLGTQQFEDYRVHHFNATRPPQVQLPMTVIPQPVEYIAGQASLPKVPIAGLDHSTSSIMGKNGEANLTMEGKRQAQAAGEKLRARTTFSRYRKGTMTAVDSHQNRWANYKSSTSAFLPKASPSASQDFDGPGLTSEGKRQAQVAGDKLRCRTNPIRHSRPSRVGSLEHGICKNRWSSYSGIRATRFDEHQDAQEEAKDTSNTMDTDKEPKDGQPSLLEVFEAELAKKISATDSEEAPGVEPPAARTLVPESATLVDPPIETLPAQIQPLPQESHALLELVNEHLQELTAGDMQSSQDLSTAIDHGIRTAVNGVGACIQGIAGGLQEASNASRQAADRTRDVENQLMDDAILGFQSLTRGFTAALRRELAANWPGTTSAPRSGPGEVEPGSSSTTLATPHDRDPDEDVTTAPKSNKFPLKHGVDPSETAYNSRPNHGAAPKYISDISASPDSEMERQSRSRPTMSKEPRFHRPGPIHLPHRPGYVDRLRRSQSSQTFDKQDNIHGASSPRVDTHFPILAQFEGENIEAAPSFPALPGMEPLIPQRAPRQSIGESAPANGTQSCVSGSNGAEASRQSHNSVAGPREHSAQRDRHEVIPPSGLSSAARLAGPFDPLEAEPSARPHLTERLRRNATVASTDTRHAARRRRPYSEVFDGSGRVAWDAFLRDNGHGPKGLYRASDDKGRPLGANQEYSRRNARRVAGLRRSPLAAAVYDDQHHDDSTVGKINDCVEQLRDLGFGGDDENSAGRLLVYAQAADGVLVDAIDLIDEEQRAYKERL